MTFGNHFFQKDHEVGFIAIRNGALEKGDCGFGIWGLVFLAIYEKGIQIVHPGHKGRKLECTLEVKDGTRCMFVARSPSKVVDESHLGVPRFVVIVDSTMYYS